MASRCVFVWWHEIQSRQTGRQADRQTGRNADTQQTQQTHTHTCTQTNAHKQTHTDTLVILQKEKAKVEAEKRTEFHRQVWMSELARLNSVSNRAQEEFQRFLDDLAQTSTSEHLLRLILNHNEECKDVVDEAAAVRLQVRDAQAAARRAFRRYGTRTPSAPSSASSLSRARLMGAGVAARTRRTSNTHKGRSSAGQLSPPAPRQGSEPQAMHRHRPLSGSSPSDKARAFAHMDKDIAAVVKARDDISIELCQLHEDEVDMFEELVSMGCVEGCTLSAPAIVSTHDDQDGQDDHSGGSDNRNFSSSNSRGDDDKDEHLDDRHCSRPDGSGNKAGGSESPKQQQPERRSERMGDTGSTSVHDAASQAPQGRMSSCLQDFEAFERLWQEDLATIMDSCAIPGLSMHLKGIFEVRRRKRRVFE